MYMYKDAIMLKWQYFIYKKVIANVVVILLIANEFE